MNPPGPPARLPLVLVFSGAGGQCAGMGARLFEEEPAFRAAWLECEAALRPHLGGAGSLRGALERDGAADDMAVVLPALFCLQAALGALLGSWGAAPVAVVGHSAGDVAAAHAAGVLPLDEAARVAAVLGRCLARFAGRGALLAAQLPPGQAEALAAGLGGRVAVAGYNGAASTVLGGDPAVLATLAASFGRRGVFCRPVRVPAAAHTPWVAGIREAVAAELGEVAARPGTAELFPSGTGGAVEGALDGGYWSRCLAEPVRLGAALDAISRRGPALFVELGPHPLLAHDIEAAVSAPGSRAQGGQVMWCLRRGAPEEGALPRLREALGAAGSPA